MQPVKGFYCTIFEINKEEFERLTTRWFKDECTACEQQLYIYHNHEIDKFIAIDNTIDEMYIEEFKHKEDAYIWLLGLKAVECLQKAEDTDFWW